MTDKLSLDGEVSKKAIEEYANILGLPGNSTLRLCELRMAQVEVETRAREGSVNELASLETKLKEEIAKYLALKQVIDKELREKNERRNAILKVSSEIKFYKDKVNRLDNDKLDRKYMDSKLLAQQVLVRREGLKKLLKSLGEFNNIEPTNEALKHRIDELKKSRLSLEMTFVDE